jgi:predicted nucleotidyltransferase
MDMPAKSIREAVMDVARRIDARLVVLYGSAAHVGRRSRDIDLAILPRGELDLLDLTNRLTSRLGVQEVDLVDLRRADPLLLMFVATEGIPLYEAEPGEFARLVSLAARRYADTRKFRETERQEILDFLERQR